jgi:hypothetical protein
MFSSIKKAIETISQIGNQASEAQTSSVSAFEWGAFSGVRPEQIRQMDLPLDKVLPNDGLVNAKCAGANLADCYIKVGQEEKPLDAYLIGLSDKELNQAISGMICDENTVWSSRPSLDKIIVGRIFDRGVKVYDDKLDGLDLSNACIPSVPLNARAEALGNVSTWQPKLPAIGHIIKQASSGLSRGFKWARDGVKNLLTDLERNQSSNQEAVTEQGRQGQTANSPQKSAVHSGGSAPESKSGSSANPAHQASVAKPSRFASPFHEELYNNAKASEDEQRKRVAKGSPGMGEIKFPHLQSRLYDASNLPAHRQIDSDLVTDNSPDATERRRRVAQQSLKAYADGLALERASLDGALDEARQNNFFGLNEPHFRELVREADNARTGQLLDAEKQAGRLPQTVSDIDVLWAKKRADYVMLPQNVDGNDFYRRAERIEGMPLPALQKDVINSPSEALELIGFAGLAKEVEGNSLSVVLEELESQVRELTEKQLEITAKYEHGMSQLEMLATPSEKPRPVTLYNGGYDELVNNYQELLDAQVKFVAADFLGSHFTHNSTLSPTELAYLQRVSGYFSAVSAFEQDKLMDLRQQAAAGDTLVISQMGSADHSLMHGFMPNSRYDFAGSAIEQDRAAGVPYRYAKGFVVDSSQLVEEATKFNHRGRRLDKSLTMGLHPITPAVKMPLATNRFSPLYMQIGANEKAQYRLSHSYTKLERDLRGKQNRAIAIQPRQAWDIARERGVPASLWSAMEQFSSISEQSAEFYLGCRYSVCMNKQLELGLPAAYLDYFSRRKDGSRLK